MLDWGFAQVDQQWYTTPADIAAAERMYAEVKPLQPKYWRIGAAWPLIAKTKEVGTFIAGTPPTSTGRDWSTLDTSLNEALLIGADIVLILGVRKAAWGGFTFGPFSFGATTGTAADFGVWCAEVATRYKVGGPGVRTDGKYAPNSGKGVHIFEVWNEQNDQNHWGGQISAQDYTNHLIAAYDAIKAVSGLSGTNSRILFGGTYHVQRIEPWFGYGIASLPEVEFLSQCYTYGAKDKFDAMNVHVYPHLDASTFGGSDVGPAPTMNLDNMKQLVEIRALMVAKGDGAKKISITKAGFPVSVVGEALQKTYWETLYAMLAALTYVDMVLFYCARDGGGTIDSINGSLGAMRADFTHRPVWTFLQTLSPPPAIAANFAATATFTAPASRHAYANFAATSTFTASVSPRVTASFAAESAFSAIADTPGMRNALFASEATFTATVHPSLPVGAGFGATSTFTATVKPSLARTAGFGATASFTATAFIIGPGRNANFGAAATFSATVQTPVLWNSTGAGNRDVTGGSGAKIISWSHNTTVAGSGVWAIAILGYSYATGLTGLSVGCNYGSTPMTLLGSKGGTQSGLVIFGLQNPPTGSQTVTATVTPAGSGSITSWQGTSVSYTNVGAVVTPTVSAGASGTLWALTLAAGAGSRPVAVTAGGYLGSPAGMTISHAERYRTVGSPIGKGGMVTIQDGPGEADGFVTLGTASPTSAPWIACGLVLTPV